MPASPAQQNMKIKAGNFMLFMSVMVE